jgi:hypothetical protein
MRRGADSPDRGRSQSSRQNGHSCQREQDREYGEGSSSAREGYERRLRVGLVGSTPPQEGRERPCRRDVGADVQPQEQRAGVGDGVCREQDGRGRLLIVTDASAPIPVVPQRPAPSSSCAGPSQDRARTPNLAFLEAKRALATIARNFHIELDSTAGPVSEHYNFVTIPKGLHVRLTQRSRQNDTRSHRR